MADQQSRELFDELQERDDMRQQEQIASIEEFYQTQLSEAERVAGARRESRMHDLESQAIEAEKQGRYARAASGNIGGSKEAVDKARLGASITKGVADVQAGYQQDVVNAREQVRNQFQQELSSVYQRNPYYAEAMNAIMMGFDISSTAAQQRFMVNQQMAQSKALYGQRLGQIIGNAISLGGQTYANHLRFGEE